MMHTLIAGISGSGKTTLERMVISALAEGPAEFILIDPKIVGLSRFKNSAGVLAYACEDEEMIDALDDALAIMQARYYEMDAKNLDDYDGAPLYVIVDEMADLIMGERGKTFARQLSRIATKGRAAKVMLIACTQVTNQKAIPELVLVNMVNIICLRQKNAQKYRYLLGEFPGKLPEYGVCYVMTQKRTRPARMAVEDAIKELTA